MNRRDLLQMSAALGMSASLPQASFAAARTANQTSDAMTAAPAPLHMPPGGVIPVAFLLSDGAVVIDFTGPWEVFDSVQLSGGQHPFQLYTVAESAAPLQTSGGMTIVPRYTIADAPAPKIVVIPAQSAPTEPVLAWVRNVAKTADVVMSVCTGAYLLAKTGLLSGKAAATWHGAYTDFALTFPDIKLMRGARFVDLGNLASSGGLSCGIDLALHVVERYFGRDVATGTAYNLEYQGQGWKDPNSNQEYTQVSHSTDAHPLCAVCSMEVDKATSPHSSYHGKTYYFCMEAHKDMFDSNPQAYSST